MKKASIISIGNEVLSGQTSDSNSTYLSKKLLEIGVEVKSNYTVRDEVAAIVRALKLASEDAEVVLTTGGLGPTDDDLTREGLAKFLCVDLKLDNELLQRIQDFFSSRSLKMPEKNKVQAYMPAGAKAIANNLGTAPGIKAEVNDRIFVALPGVPGEMRQMFEETVLPELEKLAVDQAIVVRKLKCFGTGESNIAELLGSLMERGRNPLINCTASRGIITLHIIATAKDKAKAQQMIQKDEVMLSELLGELIYGTGEQSLADVVAEKLTQQKKTIATAESCTGGLLAKLLTDLPGASSYFMCGWVSYSNEAKVNELGVPEQLIEKYGAVSEKVAEAMAEGARKRAGADFAIGITGIAGPTGASAQKPVGLVYISLVSEGQSETKHFLFAKDRGSVRLRAAQTALNMLRRELLN